MGHFPAQSKIDLKRDSMLVPSRQGNVLFLASRLERPGAPTLWGWCLKPEKDIIQDSRADCFAALVLYLLAQFHAAKDEVRIVVIMDAHPQVRYGAAKWADEKRN